MSGRINMNPIVRGTLILFAAGLISRLLGFAYRVVLARTLGAEGMGLLAMVQPVIFFAITLASAGLPVAISKIVAERAARDPARIRQVLRVSVRLVTVTSLVGTILLLLAARLVATRLLTDPRSFYPLLALTPLLAIVSLSVVLRGYFQGLQRMEPPALAQVLEQVVRMFVVLYLVRAFLPFGTAAGAAGAALGTVLGELTGLAVLALFFVADFTTSRSSWAARAGPDDTVRAILHIALPVTLTRIIGSVTEILDAVIIPRRLEVAGFSRSAATAFFGNLYGMAMPLLYFPTVFTFALAQSLVPAVSEAQARGDRRLLLRRASQAIQLAALVSYPTSVVFLLLGHRLGLLFYGDPSVGDLIVPLSVSAPLLYLEVTVSAILRGLGHATEATINGLIGSLLRLALVWGLTGLPHFGVRAVIIGISLDLALSFYLNLRSLVRVTALPVDLGNWLFRPLGAALLMTASLGPFRGALEDLGASLWQATLFALLTSTLLYVVTLRFLGVRLRNLT